MCPRSEGNGAGERNRTPDRLITNQLLYLLSYASQMRIAMIGKGSAGCNVSDKTFFRLFMLTNMGCVWKMCRLSEGFPSGQRDQTVNLTRKLRWFESTPHHQIMRGACGYFNTGAGLEPQLGWVRISGRLISRSEIERRAK